jgi:ABC-type polar amino acid transport system ATPase subunit
LISTHELELAKTVSDRALLMWRDGVVLDTIENLQKKDLFSKAFDMDLSEIGYFK